MTGGPLETFGDGSITVHYAGAAGSWPRLTATVAVKGAPFPVTFGSALVTTAAGVLRIPLSDQAVLLPRGQRLVVTVGGQTADGVYAHAGSSGSITIRGMTLNLSLLRRAVSR
jgi:hypothetical protein